MNGVLSIKETGIMALLGYAVVFVGLILLMLVIIISGKIMTKKTEVVIKEEPKEETSGDLPLGVMMMAATVMMNDSRK